MVKKNTALNDKIRNARELINKYGNLNEIKVLDQIIEMREKKQKGSISLSIRNSKLNHPP